MAAAAAGAGSASTSAVLGFRGYLEQPPWTQSTVTVGVKTILFPWSRAKSHASWIYGRAGYIAVVHNQNIYGEKPAQGHAPLNGRTTTIAVLSGVFDETASWTPLGTQSKTFDKRRGSPDYVDGLTEYKWLDDTAKPFIVSMCQGDVKAPLWLVFDPASFGGVDANWVRDGMLIDRDVGGDWFRGATRPMFGDVVEIRPTGKEDNEFALDSSLFERMAWGNRDVYENAAAEAESKIAQKKAWKPMPPPADYKGPVRVWSISLECDLGGGGLVSWSGKCFDEVVGREADAVKRGMEMLPEDGKYIDKKVFLNSVVILYSKPCGAQPRQAETDVVMAMAPPMPNAAASTVSTAVSFGGTVPSVARQAGAAEAEEQHKTTEEFEKMRKEAEAVLKALVAKHNLGGARLGAQLLGLDEPAAHASPAAASAHA